MSKNTVHETIVWEGSGGIKWELNASNAIREVQGVIQEKWICTATTYKYNSVPRCIRIVHSKKPEEAFGIEQVFTLLKETIG